MRKVKVYPQSKPYSDVKKGVPVAHRDPATHGSPKGGVGKMGGFAGAKKVGLSKNGQGSRPAVRGKTGC